MRDQYYHGRSYEGPALKMVESIRDQHELTLCWWIYVWRPAAYVDQ